MASAARGGGTFRSAVVAACCSYCPPRCHLSPARHVVAAARQSSSFCRSHSFVFPRWSASSTPASSSPVWGIPGRGGADRGEGGRSHMGVHRGQAANGIGGGCGGLQTLTNGRTVGGKGERSEGVTTKPSCLACADAKGPSTPSRCLCHCHSPVVVRALGIRSSGAPCFDVHRRHFARCAGGEGAPTPAKDKGGGNVDVNNGIGPRTLDFTKLVLPGESPLDVYERLSQEGVLRWWGFLKEGGREGHDSALRHSPKSSSDDRRTSETYFSASMLLRGSIDPCRWVCSWVIQYVQRGRWLASSYATGRRPARGDRGS